MVAAAITLMMTMAVTMTLYTNNEDVPVEVTDSKPIPQVMLDKYL